MIERLMNQERPYGEPEYSKWAEEITRLKNMLCKQLDQSGKQQLEQMEDAYLRRENAALCDAFADGFWSAVELMLEYQQQKSEAK